MHIRSLCITLSMLEGRICTKLGLDASKVKLEIKYNAVMLAPTKEVYISDEDVGVYISSGENYRRFFLNVDVITAPELSEQLSRVELFNKSSVGKNYAELDSNKDEMKDNADTVTGE